MYDKMVNDAESEINKRLKPSTIPDEDKKALDKMFPPKGK
jgi:hypothetical protein